MKDEGNKLDTLTGQMDSQISSLWLDEFRQSHYLLETFIAALPTNARKEFMELLQILAGDNELQKSPSSIRQKALRIITRLYTEDYPPKEIVQYESERRARERRQHDRRKQVRNSGDPWTANQIKILRTLADQSIPIKRIAKKLGRTTTAIESKARKINLLLVHAK